MIKRFVLRYELLICLSLLLAMLSGGNVVGWWDINSDLFWAFFGFAAAGEFALELYYEFKRPDEVTFTSQDDETVERLTHLMNEDPNKAAVTITHGNIGLTTSFFAFRSSIINLYKGEKENGAEQEDESRR